MEKLTQWPILLACMDENGNYFCSYLSAAIKAIDPQAMISLSVFTFYGVGKKGPNGLVRSFSKDKRYPFRPSGLFKSALDYVDIHLYYSKNSSGIYSIDEDLRSSEYGLFDLTKKPLLMGEFGAIKTQFSSIAEAVNKLVELRNNAYARKFSGSLLWTWGSSTQTFIWHGLDNNAALASALAPISRAKSTIKSR